MTRMTRPDCAVMCNFIKYTHTHTHTRTKLGSEVAIFVVSFLSELLVVINNNVISSAQGLRAWVRIYVSLRLRSL